MCWGAGLWRVTLCFVCNPIHKRISTANLASACLNGLWLTSSEHKQWTISWTSAFILPTWIQFQPTWRVKQGVIKSGDNLGVRQDGRLRGRREINTGFTFVLHLRDQFHLFPIFSTVRWPPSSWPDEDFKEEALQHSDQMGRVLFLYLLFIVRTVCLQDVLCTRRGRSSPHFLLTGFGFFFWERINNCSQETAEDTRGDVGGSKHRPRVKRSKAYIVDIQPPPIII